MSKDILIERYRTALTRYELSKPISIALQHHVIKPDHSIFDYGCGKGYDVKELSQKGFTINGWDPYYNKENTKVISDIINLGYVINVIENPSERNEVLIDAFNLARKCLIVSAQVIATNGQSRGSQYSDGILTNQLTFQKYYSQTELKEYIQNTLGVEPIAASLGIFYVFKDETFRDVFLSGRYMRTYAARIRTTVDIEIRLAPYKPLLEQFANLTGSIGRVPKPDEIPFFDELRTKIGSIPKCITFCEKLFDNFNLNEIQKNRRDNILVFLALSNFKGNLKLSNLENKIQRDIKTIFGSFTNAIEIATDLLYAVGDVSVISQACQKSKIGKLLPDSLYIHSKYISSLSPILRIFCGCGTIFAGDIQETTLIKIMKNQSALSYLIYEDFDNKPHPPLLKSIKVDLKKLSIVNTDIIFPLFTDLNFRFITSKVIQN